MRMVYTPEAGTVLSNRPRPCRCETATACPPGATTLRSSPEELVSTLLMVSYSSAVARYS